MSKKEEEFKIFYQANKKLQKILIEKRLINNVEEDEEFDAEDELTEKEILIIKKRGGKSETMIIGLDNTEELLTLVVILPLEIKKNTSDFAKLVRI